MATTIRRRRIDDWIAVGLSVIPGLGHLSLRRYAQGVLLFALFAIAANGVLLGALWQGPEARTIRLGSQVALVAVWVVGMASALKLTVFTDRERLRARRDEKVREGLTQYLRGEHAAAAAALEDARACDVDRADADVLFHLGAVATARGDRTAARRYFKRCLTFEPDKWRVEITRLSGEAL